MDIRNQPTSRAQTRPLTAPGTTPLAGAPAAPRGVLGHVADVFIGGGEALADMGKGLYTMIRHPIQTAKGMGVLLTKLVTDPGEGLKLIGHAFVDPYVRAFREGRPGLALGRGLVEIGSLFIGPGEVAGALKSGVTGASGAINALRAGGSMADAARSAGMAVKMAGQAADLGDKAAQLAKLGFAAEAGKVASYAKITGRIEAMARAGDVARAARWAHVVEGIQHVNVAGKVMTLSDLMVHSDALIAAGERAAQAATVAGRLGKAVQRSEASGLVASGAVRGVTEALPSAERMLQLAGRAALQSPFFLISPPAAVALGLLRQVLPDSQVATELTADKAREVATQYHLAPDVANVRNFLAETGGYQKGAVGPGVGTPVQIRQVQAALRVAGYDVTPSGAFDEATALAVVHFKKAHDLHQNYQTESGQPAINEYVDQATADALYRIVQQTEHSAPAGQVEAIATQRNLLPTAENVAAFQAEVATYGQAVGPDSGAEAVKRVQSLLGRLGYQVPASGTLDDATAEAIMAFKKKAGIHQTYRLPNGDFAINEYVDPVTELRMRSALQAR